LEQVAEPPDRPAGRNGSFFWKETIMIRRIALIAVLTLALAPAFLLTGCQTSSDNKPNALSGDNSHVTYPKTYVWHDNSK
jgi:hypothetical protein